MGLQERIGRNIDARERIVSFIPEYVGYLLNRLSQGEDGKVLYETIKGKKPIIVGVEFGEVEFGKRFGERWLEGRLVGIEHDVGEGAVGGRRNGAVNRPGIVRGTRDEPVCRRLRL